MTTQEFLDTLRNLGCEWYLTGSKVIRTIRYPLKGFPIPLCPITAICSILKGKWYHRLEWDRAADELEIPFEEANAIMMAADKESGYNPLLRKQLLSAVGLSGAA